MKFSIPENRINAAMNKLNTYKRKAEKLGLPFIVNEVGEEFKKFYTEDEELVTVRCIQLDVEFNVIISGYHLVAWVSEEGNGLMIKGCNDDELFQKMPNKYKEGIFCEHCNSHAHRKGAWVIYNENDDSWNMVGTTCVRLYTGVINENILNWYTDFESSIKKASEFSISGLTKYYNVKEIVAASVHFIKTYGYVSRNNGTETRPATVDAAMKVIRENEFDNTITEEDQAEADAAIEWAKSLDVSLSEFNWNMKFIASSEVLKSNFGIAAYIAEGYRRQKAQTAEEELRLTNNPSLTEYIGNVGDKLNLNVALAARVGSYDTQFGVTFIYKFTTDDNHICVWNTERFIEDKDLENVKTIKGTVKAQKTFRGEAQTVLTRCKIA